MVTIHYFAHLQEFTKVETEQAEAATVADVLRHIRTAHGPAAQKAAKRSLIVVNDTSIELTGRMKTPLRAGDVVGFLPLCGGG